LEKSLFKEGVQSRDREQPFHQLQTSSLKIGIENALVRCVFEK
jgi:hypothetical protein